MLRLSCALFVGLAFLNVNQPVQANWFDKISAEYHRIVFEMHRDKRRNTCWPSPFLEPDRAHVRSPMLAMEANGWRRENLLGDHHFNDDSTELTKAGELKVNTILTQSPPHRRTVFIQRGRDADTTATRLDAVELYASRLLPEGQLASIVESHLIVEGTPADDVDAINVKFRQTRPTPQLSHSAPEVAP